MVYIFFGTYVLFMKRAWFPDGYNGADDIPMASNVLNQIRALLNDGSLHKVCCFCCF